METAAHESGPGPAEQVAPKRQSLYSVPDVESRLQGELSAEFDSVIAFADFCSFLTSGRVGDTAEQLMDLARALHAETTEDLRRSRPRG